MILVRMNHREFTTESKSTKLSIIRFCKVGQSGTEFKVGQGLIPDCFLLARLDRIH